MRALDVGRARGNEIELALVGERLGNLRLAGAGWPVEQRGARHLDPLRAQRLGVPEHAADAFQALDASARAESACPTWRSRRRGPWSPSPAPESPASRCRRWRHRPAPQPCGTPTTPPSRGCGPRTRTSPCPPSPAPRSRTRASASRAGESRCVRPVQADRSRSISPNRDVIASSMRSRLLVAPMTQICPFDYEAVPHR